MDINMLAPGSKPGKLLVQPEQSSEETFVPAIKWPDLIIQIFIHVGCLYGLYLSLYSAKFYTTAFAFVLLQSSGFGITAGAHRLWSHRAYKATWQLELILLFLFTIAGQRDVYMWAWDHRVHHKYGESDSDPHNVKNGFIFAHIGWVVLTPHPKVIEKRKIVDMSDLTADPLVTWHRRLYPLWFALLAVGFPVGIPVYLWDETLWNSFWICFNSRFSITLHIAFLVNSVAHLWGQKPYDKRISPVENIGVSVASLGEGWHNFHHVFPWDYRAGELGNVYNPTTTLLNFFAKIGWAYDLKYVTPAMVSKRALKTGDGSHHDENYWGYGDNDIPDDLKMELQQMEIGKNN